MGFFHHTFSDIYAHRNNWLTNVDVRVKLFYLFSMLAINLWAKNVFPSLFFLFASFTLLIAVKLSPFTMLRSMIVPISFAILILVVKCLHEGENEWVSLSLIGYKLPIKEEGLHSGLHIGSKILGGISLVMVFSFTTTIRRLNAGLMWFRIPDTIIELLSFMYRYIFLFLDEASIIWTARKTRLGHISWRKTIESFGTLGGMLLIRSFERAERTYDAMRARGYEGGALSIKHLPSWGRSEYLLVSGIFFTLPPLIYTGNIEIW
ncbi:MAG: cobalt ECF transporter T component CbiQ [Candidatus Brocadiaceae bacterium]|nr:cobalt ECF transporter T component CbiQ [Candidatus Brocadiaceae bacterium]